ncbi:Sorting nexin-19 [Mactra antiquata]
MGVMLCILISWWWVSVVLTYSITLYCSVSVTKYILICRTLLPSDILITTYDSLKEYFVNNLGLCNNHNEHAIKKVVQDDNEKTSSERAEKTPCISGVDKSLSDQNGDLKAMPMDDKLRTETSICHDRLPSELSSSQNKVNNEISAIISLIKRDFFESWYSLFSKEKSTLDDAESLFVHICQELENRLSHADTHKLLTVIIFLFKDHLHHVHQAKTMFKVQSKSRRKSQADTSSISFIKQTVFKSVEECYGAKVGLHPAVKSVEIEYVYQKSIIELLLVHLLWDNMLVSRTLVCALKEILMCNILQNVINLLCDSTFLHEKIITITSDEELCVTAENIPVITISESTPEESEVKSILTNRIEAHSKVKKDSAEKSDLSNSKGDNSGERLSTSDETAHIKWKEDTEVFEVSKKLCIECNRLSSHDKDRISPRPHSCSLGITPVFFIPGQEPDRQSVTSVSSSSSVEHKNIEEVCDEAKEIGDEEGDKDETLVSLDTENTEKQSNNIASETVDEPPRDKIPSTSSEYDERSSSNIFPSLPFSFPNPLNFIDRKKLSPSTETVSPPCIGTEIKRSLSHGDVGSSSPPWLSEETPSIFLDVQITSTETAKESYSEYTLYIVEFEALYQTEESTLVHKSGTVKRRYSEFVNLQSRLDDNAVYKKSMKDIKGPKKILPSLPFGNMGKDTVDNRKQLLESFLKSIIAKPDLCNSHEVKQFLGYSGDGHIAFVRKTADSTGPRIDQRVVKRMSDVFDKIVEGFPSLPQQLPRIIPQFEQNEEKEIKQDVELSCDTDNIDLIFDYESDMICNISVLEKFVVHKVNTEEFDDDSSLNNTTLGTSILTWQDQQQQKQQLQQDQSKNNQTCNITVTDLKIPSKGELDAIRSECQLTNAALDLLTELLLRQDHWMCRDNVIKAIKVLFGKGINRLIEEKVELFTSSEMILFYLNTFHETIWPNDELSTEERPKYTDLQKQHIKQQASRCLSEFLPGILKLLVGNEESDIAVEEVIDSLKYEKLNRHVWYTILDVILEELFPEVNTEELHRKLSGAV